MLIFQSLVVLCSSDLLGVIMVKILKGDMSV